MTFEEARQAIIGRLYNNWSATDVAWPKHPYDPSVGTAYIKPMIRFGRAYDGENAQDGVGYVAGVLLIEINIPKTGGDKDGYTYGDSLTTLFRRYVEQGLIFDDPTVEEGEATKSFYVYNFTVGFHVIMEG